MTYLPEESNVIYKSKDGREEKVFDALEWLAAMGSHVPDKGEQMVRYYGYYSNVSRGKRKEETQDVFDGPDPTVKAFCQGAPRML